MKKSDIFLAFTLVLVISFGFLSIQLQTNKAIGQTSTSSSSSSGSSTTTTTTSSSSSSSTTSSSSGSTSIEVNQNFTGLWKGEIARPKPSSSSSGSVTEAGSKNKPVGSRIITFKLCIKDNQVEGTVQQGGIINMGVITSQTVISSDEVSINIEGNKDAKATINIKLTNEREFLGTFADGRTFKARKLNPNRPCLAGVDVKPAKEPKGPTMSGPAMEGPPPSMDNGHNMSGPGPEGMSGMAGSSMGDSSGSSDDSSDEDLPPPERKKG